MLTDQGWLKYCIWEHSASLRELYARRCMGGEPEMTCAAQAAELLAPHVRPGDTLLDVGCGSGYFYHSVRSRRLPLIYLGIDAAPSLVEIGRRHLPVFGLNPRALQIMRIDDLDGEVDHVLCMNVLSNLDNFHRPLERILMCARRTVILRESCSHRAHYSYVRDEHLDAGCDLRVHVNVYDAREWVEFMESYGFAVEAVMDRRTGGRPEMVIGHPHYWTFFVARRTTPPAGFSKWSEADVDCVHV